MLISEIAQARVRHGYRKIRVLLNREGCEVGKYQVGSMGFVADQLQEGNRLRSFLPALDLKRLPYGQATKMNLHECPWKTRCKAARVN